MTTRSHISLEFVTVTITSDRELTTQPVELAIVPQSTQPPGEDDWHVTEWLDDVGDIRRTRILVGPGGDIEPDAGAYYVWVRVTDDPEIPAFIADILRIT